MPISINGNLKRFSGIITKEQYVKLNLLSLEHKTSANDIIRQALDEYLSHFSFDDIDNKENVDVKD